MNDQTPTNNTDELDKLILDVCCGGRMFWFDKQNDDVLFVRKPDGTEYEVLVFDGGGHYVALWPRTQEEIAEFVRLREENDAKWRQEIAERKEAEAKKTWRFWKKRK